MTDPAPPYATDREALERDSEVEFFTGPGPGGQHRNKSRTAVRLRHLPSQVTVTATERRSQHQNLDVAYERLAEKLEQLNQVPKKRRPTKPSRAKREARKENKRHRGETKKKRQKPNLDD